MMFWCWFQSHHLMKGSSAEQLFVVFFGQHQFIILSSPKTGRKVSMSKRVVSKASMSHTSSERTCICPNRRSRVELLSTYCTSQWGKASVMSEQSPNNESVNKFPQHILYVKWIVHLKMKLTMKNIGMEFKLKPHKECREALFLLITWSHKKGR